MPSRENGGPFWVGTQPLDTNVLEGDQWWDGTTLWERRSGAWVAVTGPGALPSGTVIELLRYNGPFTLPGTIPLSPATLTLCTIPIPDLSPYTKLRVRGQIHVQLPGDIVGGANDTITMDLVAFSNGVNSGSIFPSTTPACAIFDPSNTFPVSYEVMFEGDAVLADLGVTIDQVRCVLQKINPSNGDSVAFGVLFVVEGVI